MTSVVLSLACSLLSGCGVYREATDESLMARSVRPVSGPFAIDGIRPDMTSAECLKLLGNPKEKFSSPNGTALWRWASDVTVSLSADDHVTEVSGNSISGTSSGAMVALGPSEAEFRAMIPAAVGSDNLRLNPAGIFGLPRIKVGTTYVFQDGSMSCEVDFHSGGRRARMSREPSRPRQAATAR